MILFSLRLLNIYTHTYVCTQLINIFFFFFFFYLFCFYFFTRKKDRIILSASCLTRKCICLLRYNNNHINISNFFLKQNFFHNSRSIFFFFCQIKQCANSCAMRISDPRLFLNLFLRTISIISFRENNFKEILSRVSLQSSNSLNYFFFKIRLSHRRII